MPKHLISVCLSAALLAACSTQPKLAMPDGRTRVPINSQAAIDEYTAAAKGETEKAKEEAQQRQLAAVKRDLAELKVLMAEVHQEGLPAPGRKKLPVRATTGMPGAAEATASTTKYMPSEKIMSRGRSKLFTVSMGVGETRFAPSVAFQQALLGAAKNAKRIEIRGATDATKAKVESARIAKARAENARQYLLNHGIELARLKTTYLAARGFTADNSTSAGKARNRRVEIEVMARDTAASATKDRLPKGAMP